MQKADFVKRVETEMAEIGSERAILNEGDQFAVWCGTELLGFEVGLVAERLHIGGSGDEKIDLGVAEEDVPIRILAQCKFSAGGAAQYSKDEVEEVLTGRKRALEFPTLGSQKRQEFTVRYKAAEQKPERLLCIGLGRFTPEAFDYAVSTRVVIYDIDRIYEEWLTRRDPARLSMPKLVSIPADKESLISRGKEPRRTFITTISSKNLYKLVDEHGLGLFSENFRYKLPSSARSDAIALATKATLETEPHRFLERNNGLTFVGERVDWDSKILQIVNPQIVNGCQTSYAIHEWYKQRLSANHSLEELPEGEIAVKIIEARSEDARKIAEATNRQNPISARDLHATSGDQQALALAFHNHSPKIFFETREGAWSAVEAKHETDLYRVPGLQRFREINNEMAGQIMLAFLGFPHWSKDRKKAIWDAEALNKAIFGIQTPAKDRFATLREETPTAAVLDSIDRGTECFIADILFGNSILQCLEAIRLKLLPKKLELWSDPQKDPMGRIVSGKQQYMGYWDFHFAALLNFILVTIKAKKRADIEEARGFLLGTDVNMSFSNPGKRAAKFKLSEETGIHEILEADKMDPKSLGHFSQWFNSIDQIFYDLLEESRKSEEFKNLNHFFYKQDNTFKRAVQVASKWLGSKTERELRFPLPGKALPVADSPQTNK